MAFLLSFVYYYGELKSYFRVQIMDNQSALLLLEEYDKLQNTIQCGFESFYLPCVCEGSKYFPHTTQPVSCSCPVYSECNPHVQTNKISLNNNYQRISHLSFK